MIKQGEKYDLSRGNNGRFADKYGKKYSMGNKKLKWVVCERKFVIFFPRCVSVISSTRLWKRHLCQALNIALNTPIQGIDPDGICVLPSRRSERANFTKIPRSELSTFSKLIPISRLFPERKKIPNFFPPFLATISSGIF